MNEYSYTGPVMLFDQCICEKWTGSTYAVSEQQARNNLTYRFKKQHGYEARTRITLPGRIKQIPSRKGIAR